MEPLPAQIRNRSMFRDAIIALGGIGPGVLEQDRAVGDRERVGEDGPVAQVGADVNGERRQVVGGDEISAVGIPESDLKLVTGKELPGKLFF